MLSTILSRCVVCLAVTIAIVSIVVPFLPSIFSPQRNSYPGEDTAYNITLSATSTDDPTTSFKGAKLSTHNNQMISMRIRRESDESVHARNIEQFKRKFGNAPNFNALPKADFVDILEKMSFGSKYGEGQAWGFVIFRTVYGDESKWASFKSLFDQMIQSQFEQAAGEYDKSGLDKFGPRWKVMWVEDEKELNNASIEKVRSRFNAMLEEAQQDESEEGTLLNQLNANEILMVDSTSLYSVISKSLNAVYLRDEGEEERGVKENHVVNDGNTPFVTIIETNYTPEESESWNKGYLKVAIAGLVNEIWPNLAGDLITMEEQMVPVERIWRYVFKADNLKAIVHSCMTDSEPNLEAMYASDSSAPFGTSSVQQEGTTYVVDHAIELSTIKYFLASIIHDRLPSGTPFSTLNIAQDTLELLNQEWSAIGIEKEGTPASTLMTIIGSHQDDTNLQVLETALRGLKARVWTAVPSLIPPVQYRVLTPLQRLLALQKIVGVFNYLNSPTIQSTIQSVYANINTALTTFEAALASRDQTRYDIRGAWKEFFLDVARNMEMNAQLFLMKRIREEQEYLYEEHERIVEMNAQMSVILERVQGEDEGHWYGDDYKSKRSLTEFALDGYEKLAQEVSTLLLFDTGWLVW